MTSNSRMMFAFSRDGALPHFFHKVDAKFQSPIRTGIHYPQILYTISSLSNTISSLARRHPLLPPRSPVLRVFRGLRSRDLHRHDRPVHFLRHPHPDRSHLPQRLQEGPLQPQNVLAPRRARGRPVDRLHHHHLLPADHEPGHEPDAQLYRCGGGDHCDWSVGELVFVRAQVVYGADQAGRDGAGRLGGEGGGVFGAGEDIDGGWRARLGMSFRGSGQKLL